MRIAIHEKIDIGDVRAEMDRAWKDLLADPAPSGFSAAALDELRPLQGRQVAGLQAEGHGLDPLTIAYLIAFAPVAAEIAKDVWTNFLLPRLRKKFGDDAIRDEPDRR